MAGTPDWSQGGLEEAAEEVYRIPLPLPGNGLKGVNAYLLRHPEGSLLVDCGWDQPATLGPLQAALTQLGVRGSVRQLFATHFHYDHIGAAAQIRAQSRALVSLGLGDRESITLQALQPELARERIRQLLRRHGGEEVLEDLDLAGSEDEADGGRPPLPDLYLTGGLVRLGERELEVLPTPGHTRGHLCLFDRGSGELFAGDHVLPHITPSIGVEVPSAGLPLADYLASLRAVRDLPASLVLPAHGPLFTDLRGRVDELLEHHRERLQLCLEAVASGSRNAAQVAALLPWTRRNRRLPELDSFNRRLAVSETAAHLELLAHWDRLERLVADSKVEFRSRPDAPRGPLEVLQA